MTDSIKMPPDLMQLPQFRQLCDSLGDAREALMAWWLLFQQLKYLAQEGGPVGRILQGDVEPFKRTLAQLGKENGCGHRTEQPLFDILVEVRLLKSDGPDWVCPRFQVLNAGDRFGKGMASMGGNMKAYKHRQERAGADAAQQSLAIHEAKYVDEEGVPLPSELVQRVTRLIISCDNALFKPSRPPILFTEGLIQQALAICRKYNDPQIEALCELVAKNREHPRLMDLTTERLLPQFGELVRELE